MGAKVHAYGSDVFSGEGKLQGADANERERQAGAELCQAQLKLELGLYLLQIEY